VVAWNAPCTRIRVAGSRGSELPSQVKVPTTRFLSAPFAGDFAPGFVIVGRPPFGVDTWRGLLRPHQEEGRWERLHEDAMSSGPTAEVQKLTATYPAR
jgi:hypothetical protein